MQRETLEPEFSRPLPVDKVTPHGVEQEVVAQSKERQKLAERFGLLEIKELKATLHAALIEGGRAISVSGMLQSKVVQRCVVTLEPLPATIEQAIEARFAVRPLPVTDSAIIADPDMDDIEAVENGVIDLGELAAQTLGVALDPYPRKPDLPYVEAHYPHPNDDSAVVENPFAKLAELNKRPANDTSS